MERVQKKRKSKGGSNKEQRWKEHTHTHVHKKNTQRGLRQKIYQNIVRLDVTMKELALLEQSQ